MVAAAVRMRTPAMMARGAASMRRPQVSYKFQEVIQYAPQLPLYNLINPLLTIDLRAGTNCPASPRFPATMLPRVCTPQQTEFQPPNSFPDNHANEDILSNSN
jgi:hypothetical protein